MDGWMDGWIGRVKAGGMESVGGVSEREKERGRERERGEVAAVREVISSATFRQDEL